VKLRGKARLLGALCAAAEHPAEVVALATLINRALDRGALKFNHGEPAALSEMFTKYGNKLLREHKAKAEQLVVPAGGLVGPDGRAL